MRMDEYEEEVLKRRSKGGFVYDEDGLGGQKIMIK
jgi:hypothetical protein